MLPGLSRARTLGAAAVLATVAGVAAPAHGAPPRVALPQTGAWQSLGGAAGVAPELAFKVVHAKRGDELRNVTLTLQENCIDPAGQTPPVTSGISIGFSRTAISKTGHFRWTDGEAVLSGRVTASRAITATADVPPGSLNCSGALVKITTAPAAPVRTVTVRSTGRAVRLKVGDRLAVDVPSNPSTGYSWRVSGSPRILGSLGTAYTADPVPPTPEGAGPVVGSGGRQRLLFDAARTGTGRLTLTYRRSNPAPGDKRLTVRVTVTR